MSRWLAAGVVTLAGCRQLLGFEDVQGAAGDGPVADQRTGDGRDDGVVTDDFPDGFACPSDSDLLACYTFDGDTLDQTPNAHHLTATGTSFGQGKDGQGISITAGANVGSGATTAFNVDKYTIRMFINPVSLPAGANRFGLFDSNFRYRMFLHSSGVIRCAFTNINAGSVELFSPTNAVSVGVWTRVACTYDGTTLRVLIDDVEVASKVQLETVGSSSENIVVGQNSPTGENFEGLIDNLEVWRGVH